MSGDEVTKPIQPEGPPMSRRGFLEWLIGALAIAGGLAGLSSVLSYLRPGVPGTWGAVEVAGVNEIAPGQAEAFPFKGSTALVIHLSGDRFVAYSALCTHAGCLVRWDPDRGQIICPCHLGVFDIEGNVVSGMPPRPLRKLRVELVGDRLLLAEA
jgi:cytochrome b6-f complex iron-sulfur subunit